MAFAVASLPVAPPLPRPSALAAWVRRPRATPPRFVVVLAASSGGDGERAPPTFGQLREELLQLHAEADVTQSKANSTRIRLVRLTEAAENLKNRAANSIRMGRENEAVDLLVQKKKLTKALENIRERIEVLDRLSAKISEAISMKQNTLIECALRPETSRGGENSDDKIRVFSNGASSNFHPKSVQKKSFEMTNEVHANMDGDPEQKELQMAGSFTFFNDHDPANSVKNCSAYDGFLEHIDLQLKSLEYEIEQFIRSQSIEEVGNLKQIRLPDILKLVKETRERMAKILYMAVEDNGSEDLG